MKAACNRLLHIFGEVQAECKDSTYELREYFHREIQQQPLAVLLIMSKLRNIVFITIAALAPLASGSAQAPPAQLAWHPWSASVFAQARSENKFVLLDLEAVWCHWCHVMDDVTYRDPAVVQLLNQRYLLVKVDQDARPDISNRYQDYGWPATVVFAADGSEIVKRQGYIAPLPMASMLQAIIDDPSPGPSVVRQEKFSPAAQAALDPALLQRIETEYEAQYDQQASGWGQGHKYLDSDAVEYALGLAARGNAEYAKRVADTLHNAALLLDPAWGGMYQYSVGGRWSEPHFEKLISVQADALRIYSLAYAQTQNPEYLQVAQRVREYVKNFLTSPDGAFYVSQDADLVDGQENESYFKLPDRDRRAHGIPRIDKHLYSRENGEMIAALCDYYAATGETTALDQAKRSTDWIVAHRSVAGGGFRHSGPESKGLYLGDTLAMGRAFLALYKVTGTRRYLTDASSAERFIQLHFPPASSGTGYLTSSRTTDPTVLPLADRDENIALVRLSSMLAAARGNAKMGLTATEAMRFLAAESVALLPPSAGILLANQDWTEAPLHVLIVGVPSAAARVSLHSAHQSNFSQRRSVCRQP